MPSYVVQGRDPRRIADAVIRYQVTQPRFALVLAVALVVFALSGGATGGVSVGVGGVVLILVVVIASVAYRRRKLAGMLARSGYRPGAVLTTSFGADDFTIQTAVGAARHPYGQVQSVRQVRDVVLLRMGMASVVVALPAELVPPGALRLTAGPRG